MRGLSIHVRIMKLLKLMISVFETKEKFRQSSVFEIFKIESSRRKHWKRLLGKQKAGLSEGLKVAEKM